MRKFLLTALVAVATMASTPIAYGDTSIGVEFGFGFGKSGSRTDTNNTDRFCRNRNWGGLKTIMIRARHNDVELHGGRWWHDTQTTNCNRSSNVVGLGYVFSTEGRGVAGQKDYYASWTPGISYVWSDRKTFLNQRPKTDTTVTNWRMSTNWHMFNRVAIGTGDRDSAFEVAWNHYGAFNDDPEINNEQFITFGFFNKKLDENGNVNGVVPGGPIDEDPSDDNEEKKEDPNEGTPGDEGDNGNGKAGDDNGGNHHEHKHEGKQCRPGFGFGDKIHCHTK